MTHTIERRRPTRPHGKRLVIIALFVAFVIYMLRPSQWRKA